MRSRRLQEKAGIPAGQFWLDQGCLAVQVDQVFALRVCRDEGKDRNTVGEYAVLVHEHVLHLILWSDIGAPQEQNGIFFRLNVRHENIKVRTLINTCGTDGNIMSHWWQGTAEIEFTFAKAQK